MLKLYYSKKSCAYAPHILLYDAEADFEVYHVDFENEKQKSEKILSINQKGRVPVILTPEGILTENPAILYYIAQKYPKKQLAPIDPFSLGEAQAFNMFLASTVHVAHAHKNRGSRWVDDKEAEKKMSAKVTSNMFLYASMIEDHYLKEPFVLGDCYSMCDPYLALITRWLGMDGVSLDDFPKLKAHDILMKTRSSVKSVLPLYD